MIKDILQTGINAAESSGKILIKYFEKLNDTRQKNENIRDLVTEVDIISEENIKSHILRDFPSHSILGEESGQKNQSSDYYWHIDPIDGTVNYSQRIPFCAVSLGVKFRNQVIVGVVFNPFTNELFYASKDGGAFLNGKSINVSSKESTKNSLFAAAFSSKTTVSKEQEYSVFGEINDATLGVLRTGSAALNLAFVACGRVDGCWSKNLHSWDIVAGSLLVEEAGGKVTNLEGLDYNLESTLIASNGLIHEELLYQLRDL